MRTALRWAATVAVAALAGCLEAPSATPEAEPSKLGRCQNNLASKKTSVSGGCTICGDLNNLRRALDGSLGTYARLELGPMGNMNESTYGSGTAMITAIAPAGVTFPAGGEVGGVFRFPGAADGGVYTVDVITYLNGAAMEVFNGDVYGGTDGRSADWLIARRTTLAYDSVELIVTLNALNAASYDVRLYEFCS